MAPATSATTGAGASAPDVRHRKIGKHDTRPLKSKPPIGIDEKSDFDVNLKQSSPSQSPSIPLRTNSSKTDAHKPAMQSISSLRERISQQPLWIILAIASGACAAINGVFAKLTTTALTSTLASTISHLFGLKSGSSFIDVALRSAFFTLNVVFNIIMWTLFTAALTRATSTTRVSIVNVSSNFFVTAVLGAVIFGEKLPVGWWLGAALLAAGNIVIGKRKEGEDDGEEDKSEENSIQQQQDSRRGLNDDGTRRDEEEPLIELER